MMDVERTCKKLQSKLVSTSNVWNRFTKSEGHTLKVKFNIESIIPVLEIMLDC